MFSRSVRGGRNSFDALDDSRAEHNHIVKVVFTHLHHRKRFFFRCCSNRAASGDSFGPFDLIGVHDAFSGVCAHQCSKP